MIAIVDYGAGNLPSVAKAVESLGAGIEVLGEPERLDRAAGAIIPGVGHFSATGSLGARWREAIRSFIARGRPLLGICLGMQWLFEGSSEAPEVAGLGVFRGACSRLVGGRIGDARVKVPHVGWNALVITRPSRLLNGLPDGVYMYFTHAYAAPTSAETVATTVHGQPFASAVAREGVWGVQFHPEKSGDVGLRILRNFIGETRRS